MNYFISDLHFGHENVLSFDNRPFLSVQDHDSVMIENWHNKVYSYMEYLYNRL